MSELLLASLGWPWTKSPPPPPPPPHFVAQHASLLGVLLCVAGPLCFYLALGPPLKPDAPNNRPSVKKMDWLVLMGSAARQSKEIFVAFFVAFFVLRTGLRQATNNAPTSGKVTSGEAVDGEAASLAADIMAYNLVSLVFACLSCAIGVRAWLGPIRQVGGTALERFYGRSELAERLCRLTAGYECFNIVAVVLLPEYRTVAFIGHHVVTCFLGILSTFPWCHYYSTFFFGVASLSSVPLCFGELFNALGLEGLVEASKPPFVVLFLFLRTSYWPYISFGFWQDSLWALSKPRERVHSVGAFASLLGANIFLTSLQVWWTGQICAAVGEALSGK